MKVLLIAESLSVVDATSTTAATFDYLSRHGAECAVTAFPATIQSSKVLCRLAQDGFVTYQLLAKGKKFEVEFLCLDGTLEGLFHPFASVEEDPQFPGMGKVSLQLIAHDGNLTPFAQMFAPSENPRSR